MILLVQVQTAVTVVIDDGEKTQFAHHGGENQRRGLVPEVAPNVVDATAVELPSSVEGLNPAPHIHEQMTTSNYGYDIAYTFTQNNITLEHNAMNNMNTVAHMNVHNTQY